MSQALWESQRPWERLTPVDLIGLSTGKLPLSLLAGITGFLGAMAFNIANLRSEDAAEKVGLDAQVLLKLGFVALCAVYGGLQLFRDRRLFAVLSTWPTILLAMVSVIFFLTGVTALEPLHALVSAGTIAGVMLATVSLALALGPQRLLRLAWLALAMHVACAWLMFLLVPSIGVFQEPIANGEFFARMGGLSHPNTLGQYSGLLIVVSAGLLRTQSHSRWIRLVMWATLLMAVVALVMSVSRSSVLAMLVSLAVVFRHDFLRGDGLRLLMGGMLVGLAGFTVLLLTTDLSEAIATKLAESLSKSGDTEELTSGTGRNVIWAYSLKLVGENPVLGYGLTSSKLLLSNYTFYTHNLVLNVALSGGVFAAGLVVALIGNQLVRVLTRPHIAADGILLFIVVNGLMENVIFEYIGAGATMLFALSVTWRACEAARQAQGGIE